MPYCLFFYRSLFSACFGFDFGFDFALTAACGRAVSGGCREVGLGARALGLMYKVNDNNNETGNDLKYTARLRTHQQLILPSPSSLGSAVLF